jgi:hypothetical protein
MNMRQAIETHWVSPTNHRGSRVIATTPGGHRLTHPWDYSLGIEGNHYAAAEALRAKLDWAAIVAGGATRKGYAFVTSTLEA